MKRTARGRAVPNYSVRPARDLEGFKSSVKNNGGYYLGVFEAGDPTSSKYKTCDGPFTATPACRESLYPYDYVSQEEASNLSKKMYPDTDISLDISSGLTNSYSWDTALSFIYQCSGDKSYATKGYQISGERHKTGESSGNKSVDVKCNIYDMAGDFYEYSTETSSDPNWCRTLRGSAYLNSIMSTGSRHTNAVPYRAVQMDILFDKISVLKTKMF